MIADIEFDVALHLGYVKNIDMNEKGLYVLQISLLCGDVGRVIAPVGLFSAPSCLDSYVESQKVPSVYMGSVCEVDDKERKFRTRSFVIRYKHEKHELNEGVQWRLTVPRFDLSTTEGRSPLCPELLQLRFDLMFCPLLEDKECKVDLFKHVDKLVPPSPVFSLVATQNLVLQKAGTGVHEYFPVRFDSAHYLDLDVMTHCAVTAIRYHKLSLCTIRRTLEVKEKCLGADDYSAKEGEVSPDGAASFGTDANEINISGSDKQQCLLQQSNHPSLQVAASASSYSTVISQSNSIDDLSAPGYASSNSHSGAALSSSKRLGAMSLSALKRLSGIQDYSTAAATQSQPMTGNPLNASAPAVQNNDTAIRRLYLAVAAAAKQPQQSVSSDTSSSLKSLDSTATFGSSGRSSDSLQFSGKLSAVTRTAESTLQASCGLLQSDLELLVASYTAVLTSNFDQFVDDTKHILAVRSDAHWDIEDLSGYLEQPPLSESTSSVDAAVVETEPLSSNGATSTAALMKEVMAATTECEVIDALQRSINACNSQLSLRWSTFLGAVKRAMPGVQALLKAAYKGKMHNFWRSQMLVHTKSIAENHRLLPHEEMTLLSVAAERYKAEAEEVAARLVESRTASQHPALVLARGLRLFDADFHGVPLKVPFLVLQQYIGGIHHDDYVAPPPAPTSNKSSPVNIPGVVSPHVLISGGAFDPTVRKGSVYLAFAGELLHCPDRAKLPTDSSVSLSVELPVDVTRYLSLVPLYSTREEGLSVIQACRDKYHVELLARLEKKTSALESASPVDSADSSRSKQRLMSSLQGDKAAASSHGGIDISDRSRFSLRGFVTSKNNHSAAFAEPSASHPRQHGSAHNHVESPKPSVKVTKTHLIVLQHGFLGTSYDMHLLQNAITAELPNNILVMCPHSNDEHSQDSIAQMAKRLAFEVTQFCKEKMPALLQPGRSEHRISFVGHSMGGLMIRLALQETMMKPLLNKLHTYMSLATPHIGTIFAESQLVSTGMWALFKFKKCRSLRELVLEDAIGGKVKKSLLYKMSLNGVLSLFGKVLLLSSPKDQYVPTYSARVQVSRRMETDEVHGATMTAMATNILSQLRDDQLVRLTLDNNVGDTATVNSLIGRTAHICFLENQLVATQLIATLHQYFV